MLPMWIVSGIFFSRERFPEALQPVIRALPLTALIDSLRSVMLEGAPFLSQGREILTLLLWGVLSFLLALRLFRWT
jgi:ABC-2 type transport system permease protein